MSTVVDPGPRAHDLGGAGAGAVDRDEHAHALWEQRVDALLVLCTAKGLFTVDGLRRVIEDLGPEAYASMSYYERWIASVAQNLIEAGVFTPAELAARMEAVAARAEPGDGG
jgi:hypothetical protein